MSTRVPDPPRIVFATAKWPELADALAGAGPIGASDAGEEVVTHRSSWVRRIRVRGHDVFVKTYEYAGWRDRLSNWCKHTAPWRRSRAATEATALQWLRQHGFPTAEPLAVLEWRRGGFLRRAVLVTRCQPGTRADRLLEIADEPTRRRITGAIRTFVHRLHEAGFRDRNLDLRNLLVVDDGRSCEIAKIDSPRHRLRAPGRFDDRLAREDWRRLTPQLEAFYAAEHRASDESPPND